MPVDVSVELVPPLDDDVTDLLAQARAAAAAGIRNVNVADCPGGRARLDPIAAARAIMVATTLEPIVHLAARRRTLEQLEHDVAAASAAGITRVLAVTGDAPIGAVDSGLDSLDALAALEGFEQVGVAFAPAATDHAGERARLERKLAAGATMVMTQPVFDVFTVERLAQLGDELDTHVVVGILPLADGAHADWLTSRVTQIDMPEDVRLALRSGSSGAGQRLAAALIRRARELGLGVQLMPPRLGLGRTLELLG